MIDDSSVFLNGSKLVPSVIRDVHDVTERNSARKLLLIPHLAQTNTGQTTMESALQSLLILTVELNYTIF